MFERTLAVLLVMALSASGARAAPKRAPQDYGRPKQERRSQALLWVPRVLLFPPWLVSEYLLRRPIGAFVVTAEREQWPVRVVSLFTFGDRRQILLFPSALFDFGLKPSVGFNLQWRHLGAETNSLRAHVGTWGPDWVAAKAVDEYRFGEASFSFEASLLRRSDVPFYGMGPRSGSSVEARFQATTAEVAPAFEHRFWRSSRFSSRAGLRALAFGDEACCGAVALGNAVRAGTVEAPPGFERDYLGAFQGMSLVLDSRQPRPNSGTGARLEVHGEAVFAPGAASGSGRSWLSYGATAGYAVDAWRARTFAMSVTGSLADPLQGEVPFTDQVTLGGEQQMRGYLRNRLIDRSALVGTLQYTWPVWVFLDGVMQVDIGNVFGQRFQGLNADLLRMSTGIGVRSSGGRDSGFEMLVAGGTDPFEDGFRFSSFRLVIGSHHGF